MEKTRKIFLDIGAAEGISVKFFRKYHPKADEFEIYCFEPLPENIEKLMAFKNINIIEGAASNRSGFVDLYLGKTRSGSLFRDKTTGRVDPDRKISVKAIDIVGFISERFGPQDEIWIKMNIEGAEYDIIPYLYDNGLISWFKYIFVKWHAQKIPSLRKKHAAVVKLVPGAIVIWRTDEAIKILRNCE